MSAGLRSHPKRLVRMAAFPTYAVRETVGRHPRQSEMLPAVDRLMATSADLQVSGPAFAT